MAIAFLLGAFGALVAEVLKRWQQWSELPEDQFRALVKKREILRPRFSSSQFKKSLPRPTIQSNSGQ
jgi:hypothetical protein